MRPMDPVRGRRKTARKELTHLPREDRRKTLSEKLKKNQPKRVDFPPQMAEFLLTEHRKSVFLPEEVSRTSSPRGDGVKLAVRSQQRS